MQVAGHALMFRRGRRSHVAVSANEFMALPVLGEEQVVLIGEFDIWIGGRHKNRSGYNDHTVARRADHVKTEEARPSHSKTRTQPTDNFLVQMHHQFAQLAKAPRVFLDNAL